MRNLAPCQVGPFEYPQGPEPRIPCGQMLDPHGAVDERKPAPSYAAAATSPGGVPQRPESQSNLEAVRAAAIEEGRILERQLHAAAQTAAEQQRATELAGVLARFDAEHERFFERAEQRVVRLALAVAARILHHEADVDPLLLTGAVRTALGQLSSSTESRLRVPTADFDLWNETITHLPHHGLRPTVVPDETMRTGDCLLETSMGTADLGLAAQLDELERSLADVEKPSIHADHHAPDAVEVPA